MGKKHTNQSAPTKVYKYGAWEPKHNLELTQQQRIYGHRYLNKLVELELRRRKDYHEFMAAACPALTDLYAREDQVDREIAEAERALRRRNSAERKKGVTNEDLLRLRELEKTRRQIWTERKRLETEARNAGHAPLEAIAPLDVELSQLAAAAQASAAAAKKETASAVTRWRKCLRAAEQTAVQRGLAILGLLHEERVRQARKESGCYWGTYSLVERAAKDFGQGTPPKFRRWTGEGYVGVQMQASVPRTAADVYEGRCPVLRIDMPPAQTALRTTDAGEQVEVLFDPYDRVPPTYERPGPDGTPVRVPFLSRGKAPRAPSRMRRTTAWLRIGTQDREPVWSGIPINMDRLIPENAKVTWASLHSEHVGPLWKYDGEIRREGKREWSLHLTIAMPQGWTREHAPDGRVAVVFGWRNVPEGLQVATWRGSDGRSGSLVIPNRKFVDRMGFRQTRMAKLEQWDVSPRIQEYTKRHFNTIRDRVKDWLGAQLLPEEFAERTKTLAQWRSPDRLMSLAGYWRDHRLPGDEEVYGELYCWVRDDRHLTFTSHGLERRLGRWRNHHYRQFVADLRACYKTVRIMDVDWRKMREKSLRDNTLNAITGALHRRAAIASPGRLTLLLEQGMAACERIKVTRAELHRCSACGAELPATEEATVTCPLCARQWSSAENLAQRLLEYDSEAVLV